ncbi:4Fe-4S cluster-binding domain-containing protein, partial [Parendozoicomonas callyspongiae]|uniref:4Fe-4S cluster-binding domain-containing protein n=1 Tax=Parendozoicomonas callyspongiae TaxID=2942213 RepID=UPI0038CD5EF6
MPAELTNKFIIRWFVVSFQGCTLACKGCWNTSVWSHKANSLIFREMDIMLYT